MKNFVTVEEIKKNQEILENLPEKELEKVKGGIVLRYALPPDDGPPWVF